MLFFYLAFFNLVVLVVKGGELYSIVGHGRADKNTTAEAQRLIYKGPEHLYPKKNLNFHFKYPIIKYTQ